jgi:hypothetical protein
MPLDVFNQAINDIKNVSQQSDMKVHRRAHIVFHNLEKIDSEISFTNEPFMQFLFDYLLFQQ